MGLTVREKKRVNAEVYLEPDGNDVNLCISLPNGKNFTIAYFDNSGQFYTYELDSASSQYVKDYVVLDGNVLSVC
jgi:hypothetical protein